MLGLNQISLAVNRLYGPSDDAALNLNFLSGSLDSRITFTRASTATRYNSSGLIETVASGVPRFDYDPITLAPRGLLIEEPKTNLLLNSASLSTQSVAVNYADYVLSFYGSGTVTMSGAATATVVGIGAYPNRTTYLVTPSTGTLVLTVSGTVEYAQLEQGTFATSYIPTTTTAASRANETASMSGTDVTNWYNQSEGTFVAEYANSKGSVAAIFGANDSTSPTSNRIDYRNGQGQFIVSASGVSVGLSTGIATGAAKVAIAYKLNDSASSANGAIINTQTSIAIPSGINTFEIGGTDGLNYAPNAHIARIRYYNTRKSNSELQTLTT